MCIIARCMYLCCLYRLVRALCLGYQTIYWLKSISDIGQISLKSTYNHWFLQQFNVPVLSRIPEEHFLIAVNLNIIVVMRLNPNQIIQNKLTARKCLKKCVYVTSNVFALSISVQEGLGKISMQLSFQTAYFIFCLRPSRVQNKCRNCTFII